MESFADLNYFEVDFPESFAYKLPTLKDAGAVSHCGEYHSVQADLSLPTWMEKLINEGFQVDKKTVWILEGLTGYLNEAGRVRVLGLDQDEG
jgi:O-methyltransferase involved in polyketide biosynthesis